MIAPKPRKPIDPRVYRPRRKPVTIATGFVYDDGLVFCVDTKVTTNIKTNQSKILWYSSENGVLAMTFAMAAEDLIFARAAASSCWEFVEKMDLESATIAKVHKAAEFALGEYYQEHIFTHPDRTPGAFFYEHLVGIWLRGKTGLFVSHETVLEPVMEYECIGAGEYLAKYLIRQYRKANSGPLTLEDVTLIATYAVENAIDYDERCGGEAEILIFRNSGEIDNAYRTAVYPNFRLPETFQGEMWKLFHDLTAEQVKGAANKTAPGLVEKFCERIREAEAESRRWGSGNLT